MDLLNLNPSTMSTVDLVNARFSAHSKHKEELEASDKAVDFMELAMRTATMKAYRELLDKIDKQLDKRGNLF